MAGCPATAVVQPSGDAVMRPLVVKVNADAALAGENLFQTCRHTNRRSAIGVQPARGFGSGAREDLRGLSVIAKHHGATA